jgi:hypothetical protein
MRDPELIDKQTPSRSPPHRAINRLNQHAEEFSALTPAKIVSYHLLPPFIQYPGDCLLPSDEMAELPVH